MANETTTTVSKWLQAAWTHEDRASAWKASIKATSSIRDREFLTSIAKEELAIAARMRGKAKAEGK